MQDRGKVELWMKSVIEGRAELCARQSRGGAEETEEARMRMGSPAKLCEGQSRG